MDQLLSTRSLSTNGKSNDEQRDFTLTYECNRLANKNSGQNPQPPCNYTLPEPVDIVTSESLIQAVRMAMSNESDVIASSEVEDTILEQRLASIWDAASLESYAYEFINEDVHQLLLDIITPKDSRNTNDESHENKDNEAEANTPSDQTSSNLQFKYRARTVELALGALANLASWSGPTRLLLTNFQVCTINIQILAQSQDVRILIEACRLLSGLLSQLVSSSHKVDEQEEQQPLHASNSTVDDQQQQQQHHHHLHENDNNSLLKLYQFALSGWSVVTRLVNMLHYTQHMPLRIAALNALRWCVLVEPDMADDIPLDDLADWFASWLQDMDINSDATKRLKQQMQHLVNALPE